MSVALNRTTVNQNQNQKPKGINHARSLASSNTSDVAKNVMPLADGLPSGLSSRATTKIDTGEKSRMTRNKRGTNPKSPQQLSNH